MKQKENFGVTERDIQSLIAGWELTKQEAQQNIDRLTDLLVRAHLRTQAADLPIGGQADQLIAAERKASKRGRKPGRKAKRKMSAEAIERIRQAQKKRWAKHNKEQQQKTAAA